MILHGKHSTELANFKNIKDFVKFKTAQNSGVDYVHAVTYHQLHNRKRSVINRFKRRLAR